MAHRVLWNKIVLERFIEFSGCTQFQEEVIRLRVAGYSRLEISTRLNVSLSTVDRARSILKKLYDSVQKMDMQKKWDETHECYTNKYNEIKRMLAL